MTTARNDDRSKYIQVQRQIEAMSLADQFRLIADLFDVGADKVAVLLARHALNQWDVHGRNGSMFPS